MNTINILNLNEKITRLETITSEDIKIITKTLEEEYLTFWKHELENSSKLSFYSTFKSDHKLEKYLEAIKDPYKRKCFSRFRISNHNLHIEVGRYQNIPRKERLCEICNSGEIESETIFYSLAMPSMNILAKTFEVLSRMLYQTKLTKTLKYCQWT